MRTILSSVILLFISVALLSTLASTAQAQEENTNKTWAKVLHSDDDVLVIRINAAKLYADRKDVPVVKKFEAWLKGDKKLEFSEIDEAQFIIGTEEGLKIGADDTSHNQLTFAKPQTFTAESVGELSGYQLTKQELESKTVFLGKPEREGNWGAALIDDRTLVFGVTRKLEKLLEPKEAETKAEAEEKLRKADVDFCISFSGGETAKKIFEHAWYTDFFSKSFSLFEDGVLYFDNRSTTPIECEINSKDSESAVELKKQFESYIDFAKKQITDKRDHQLRVMSRFKPTKPEDQAKLAAEIAKVNRSTQGYEAILDGIQIEVNEKKLSLRCEGEAAKQLPQILGSILLGD